MKGVHRSLLATTALLALATQGRSAVAIARGADPTGNTVILNTATATWQDNRGERYQNASNPLGIVVQGISALTVSPKETAANPSADGYPAGQNVTRTFVISNVSNIADAYRITAFTADKGQLVSLAFVSGSQLVPITINSTISPGLQPGQSITVQAVVSTTGVPIGTSFAIHLTAQTTTSGTANGVQSDTGEEWLVAAAGPKLAGPNGPDTPIVKTVNRQQVFQAQPGSTIVYDVIVKNGGGTPATNVVLTDTVPSGVTPDIASVRLNGAAVPGATLSGQTLSVPLGTLAAGGTADVSFNAAVARVLTLGTSFVNIAQISADGIAPQSTIPASVFIGTADVVFDPANGNAGVSGARISLLDASGALVPLSASASAQRVRIGDTALSQGANTQNPYVTGPGGTYGFSLQPSQVAPGGSTFYVTVAAPGYLNRRIQLVLRPSVDNQLYSVAATSEDGQPLARAGGYTLTTTPVSLNDVFGLFGNIPLFKTQTITIEKTVNQTSAQPGDRLIYTIDAGNPSNGTLARANIVDTLPAGEAYAPGTARLDGADFEPVVNGRTLTWTLQSLAAGVKHRLMYAAVIFPSVPAGTLLTNSATATAFISGTMVNVNASASANVEVIDGALSDRSVITGRVFIDSHGSGHFSHGDRGIASVRIYMEDGTSVLTDANGRFSFPAVRPGMHVLRIDSATLPEGMHGITQRLVHGLLDDGLMQDVEFALGGTP